MPSLAREIRKRCQSLRRNLATSKSARLGVRAKYGFKPLHFVQNQTGDDTWTSDGFRTSWDKTFKRAGLGDDDLHFHDLRGAAVTRLALSGCTVPEIAAITGHSPRDVEAILDAHYLGGGVELAEQAMMKLDARYGNGT
jgi:integrase